MSNINTRPLGGFLNNIDKLFVERFEIYGRILPPNRNGIMHALVKIILKAFIEVVRLRSFGKNGFQQIQVDVEFARVNMWKFIRYAIGLR